MKTFLYVPAELLPDGKKAYPKASKNSYGGVKNENYPFAHLLVCYTFCLQLHYSSFMRGRQYFSLIFTLLQNFLALCINNIISFVDKGQFAITTGIFISFSITNFIPFKEKNINHSIIFAFSIKIHIFYIEIYATL